MRTNVDLTANSEFRENNTKLRNNLKSTKVLQMWRKERCDECGRIIEKPWRNNGFCSKCEKFFARLGWNKIPSWKQLNYPMPDRRNKHKAKCCTQLGVKWRYPQKQFCYNQLTNPAR